MATEITSLSVKIGADIAGFKRGIAQVQRGVQQTENAFASLTRTVSRAKAVISGLGIAAVGRSLFRAAADLDALRRSLDTMTGSAVQTTLQLRRLREVARTPGLGFQEAVQGSVNLQAVGFSARDAERALKAFGNAIATTGGGRAELNAVIFQLTQMAAAGKILSADLRPIIQTAPAVAKALRELYGTTSAEAISQRVGSFEEFFEALITKLEEMPPATGGAKKATEEFGDALFQLRAVLGDQLLPVIVPVMQGITRLAEAMLEATDAVVMLRNAVAGITVVIAGRWLANLIRTTGVIGATTHAVRVAVRTLRIYGVAAGSAAVTTRGLAVAFRLLGGWPGLIVTALGALVTKLLQIRHEARKTSEEIRDAVVEAMESFTDLDLLQTEQQLRGVFAAIGRLQKEQTRLQRQAEEESRRLITRRVPGDAVVYETLEAGAPTKATQTALAEVNRELEIQRGIAIELGKQYNRLRAASDQAFDTTRPSLELTYENLLALEEELQEAAEQLRKLDMERALAPTEEALDRINRQYKETEERIRRIRAELARYGGTLREIAQDVGPVATMQSRPGIPTPAVSRLAAPPTRVEQVQAEIQRILDTPGITAAALRSAEFADELERMRIILREEAERRREINRLLGLEQEGLLSGIMSARSLGEAFKLLRDRVIEGAKGVGRNIWGALKDSFSSFASGDITGGFMALLTPLKNAFMSLATSAGPLIILFEAIRGVLDAIREPLQAALLPIRMFGEIIGRLMIPLFKLLFPVLKALAIAASYVAEIFYTVSGWLLTAIGAVVEAIGKLVKWVSFGTVKAIQNAGKAIRSAGKETVDMAREMGDFRRELRAMTWEDAMDRVADSANKAAEALINVPQGFKVALARFNATIPTTTYTPPAMSSASSASPVSQSVVIEQVTIQAEQGVDVVKLWRDLQREIQRQATRGGAMVVTPI